MATADIERLHYFQRQFLGAADFEAEQTYLRDMRRRHNIGQHVQGIVVGMELVEQPSPGAGGGVDVFIQPGMVVDGYGREIFVLTPTQLDPVLFGTFLTKAHRAVYIEYAQQSAQQPSAGYRICETADQYARVIETFQIVVEPKAPFHDDVIVGGKVLKPGVFPPPSPPPPNPDLTIPFDESVPYQELPDDLNNPKWLIRLGSVFWDGPNQQFITTTPEVYSEKRIYAGVIADRIFAPTDKLTISPRDIPSDASPSDLAKRDMDVAFAEVRGQLQVDGAINAQKDINLDGGKLSFLDAAGADGGVPLWMRRMDPPTGTGVDLRIHVGNTPDAKNRLTIGPTQGSSELAVLAVRADNIVKIETGTLDFGNSTRQMVNFWSSDETTHQYGIGVQGGALYFRTDSEFYWYKDGDYNLTAGNPGPGGSVQLRLNSSGLSLNGGFDCTGNVLIGNNTDPTLTVRRIQGKGFLNNTISDLFLNWETGQDVWVGNMGGLTSSLHISGDLHVRGNNNLIKVAQRTFALRNGNNTDNPRTQHCDYSGEGFDRVYSVFVVLQGFSVFDNEGNLAFNSMGHVQGIKFIPQHAYVRVTTPPPFNNIAVDLECFCAESDPAAPESDNSILFTVVIIGRTAA